ncbi:NAD(P)-binding domain-containing protein [Planococcus sp. APC 4015]|nr:NAD(P)-binding domain-containing protein [Planococcus sp. APC 4015]
MVGAGHSGLAVAAELIARGLRPQTDFAVVDAASDGQRSWSHRWHSLRLRTTARDSALPGLPFPGDQRRHPRADEMAAYLHEYADHLTVRPIWSVTVTAVRRPGVGTTLELETTVGAIQTRNVVAATGGYVVPRRPDWAFDLQVPGVVLHSHEYAYPRQVPPGRVVVVGGGDAAVEVATELAASHEVVVSTRNTGMQRALLGFRRVLGESGQTLPEGSITVASGVVSASGRTLLLEDGTQLTADSVILATGYFPGDCWLPDTVTPRPRNAETDMPGLFVVGIPGYGDRHQGRITTVPRIARRVARRIVERP